MDKVCKRLGTKYAELAKDKDKGFTLIELVVVIAIMAVLSTIIVPNLTEYVERARRTRAEDAAIKVHRAAMTTAAINGEWVYAKFKDSAHDDVAHFCHFLDEKNANAQEICQDGDVRAFIKDIKSYLNMSDKELENYQIVGWPHHPHTFQVLYYYTGDLDPWQDVAYVNNANGKYKLEYFRKGEKFVTSLN